MEKRDFGIAELKAAIESRGFKDDVQELNSYAANIKQERPIVWLLAKHLCRSGFTVALEKERSDLVVQDDVRIECKFYYESDMLKLGRELEKAHWRLDALEKKRDELNTAGRSTTWGVALPIMKDVLDKSPDMFILIVCSRDLRKTSKDDPIFLQRIGWWKYELRYNQDHGFNLETSIGVAKKYLDLLREAKHFNLENLSLDFTREFPSTYHFYLCGFSEEATEKI